MATCIHLHTNFSYRSLKGDVLTLPPSVSTVADLLRYIGEEIQFVFLDPITGDLRPDIEVTLNNKEIWFYSKGLQRSLTHNDTLEITLIPLGGG